MPGWFIKPTDFAKSIEWLKEAYLTWSFGSTRRKYPPGTNS